MLSLFKSLSELRAAEPALCIGNYKAVDVKKQDIFAYMRVYNNTEYLIVLNFGNRKHKLNLSEIAESGEIVISTGMKRKGVELLESLKINPDEGLLIKIN